MYLVKMQHAYTPFVGFLIDDFCMYVDFYSCINLGISMLSLCTAYRWQAAVSSICGPVCEGGHRGNTPIPNYTFSFNLLGMMFYMPMY